MKRILIVSILLLSCLFSLVAEDLKENYNISQTIQGFVELNNVASFELYVGSFQYNSGNGINLDINDSNNNLRYLIAPTQTPMSEAGLLVSTVTLAASQPVYRLRITHNRLSWKNPMTNVWSYLDYELAFSYKVTSLVNGSSVTNTVTKICKSRELDPNTTYDSTTTSTDYAIIVSLTEGGNGGNVTINDAGLHFRLRTAPTVSTQYVNNNNQTKTGHYDSTIYIDVESL